MEQHPTAAYCFTGSYIVDEVGNMLDKDMDRWTKKQQNNLMKYKLFSGTNYAAKIYIGLIMSIMQVVFF